VAQVCDARKVAVGTAAGILKNKIPAFVFHGNIVASQALQRQTINGALPYNPYLPYFRWAKVRENNGETRVRLGLFSKAVSALNCTFANCYEIQAAPYFITRHLPMHCKVAGSRIYRYF
jgi:hypothetical protein